jgi:hypothetical protein
MAENATIFHFWDSLVAWLTNIREHNQVQSVIQGIPGFCAKVLHTGYKMYFVPGHFDLSS